VAAANRRRRPARLLLLLLLPLLAAVVAIAAPAAAELRVPEREPATARQAARRVLARPEYRRPAPSLVQRARAWALRQLERLIGALLGGGRARTVFWVVVAIAVVATVVVLVRFGRGVTADPSRRVTVDAAARRTAAEWRAEADAHERAGRWRAGLRCRYRALIAELVERGLVDDVPGRTSGEYRQEVRERAPAVAEPFAGATELFELAWYGRHPSGADQAARFDELAGRVLTGAGR
jgi:hypothetical protein